MKTFLTVFFASLFYCTSFAQFKSEYLQPLPAGIKEFPFKDNTHSWEVQSVFPYEQVRDSLSGKWIVRKNEKYDPDSEQNQFFKNSGQAALWNFNAYQLSEVPPHLDSLSDGLYTYYFRSIPFIDGDTLKFREKVVSALIPIRNNQINGEVKWFYPNGLLRQATNYRDDLKNGASFMQNIDFKAPKKTTEIDFEFASCESGSFKENRKDGVFKTFVQTYTPKGKPYVLFEEQVSYQMEVLHGSFVRKTNGIVSRSGQFEQGKAVGKWIHNQWKNGKINGKMILHAAYEINDQELATKTPFFQRAHFPLTRNNTLHRSLSFPVNYDEGYLPSSFAGNFSPTPFYSEGHSILENTYEISNCLHLTSNHYPGLSDKINPEIYWSFTDSSGKQVHPNVAIKTCGVIFKYKNIAIHYPNGQLHYQFDFTQPDKLFAQPVFYANGKKMYDIRFDSQKNSYSQSLYDSLGKLVKKSICNEWGEEKESIYPLQALVIEGRRYQNYYDHYWVYENTTDIDPNSSEVYVYNEYLSKKNLKPFKSNHYIPSSRSGIIVESDDELHAKKITTYQFSEDYHRVKIKDSMVLDKLWYVRETELDLTQDGLAQILFKRIEAEKIPYQLLARVYFSKVATTPVIHWKNEAFTGTLNFNTGEKSSIAYQKASNQVTIVCKQPYSAAIRNFLSGFPVELHFYSNWEEEAYNDQLKAAMDQLSLATISMQFQKGNLVNEIRYIAKNGYPLKTNNIQSGTITTYNEFPYILSRHNINRAPYYEDTVYSYISSVETQNAAGTSTLKLDCRQDTVYYSVSDPQSQISRSISFEFKSRKEYTDSAGLLIHFIKTDTSTKKPITFFDRTKQILQTYHLKTGKLSRNYFFHGAVQLDSIYFFEEGGALKQILHFSDNILLDSKQFENGLTKSVLHCNLSDSTRYRFDELDSHLANQIEHFHNLKKEVNFFNTLSPSGKLTKYDVAGKITEAGPLFHGDKKGTWSYHYPQTIGSYQIDFKDTTIPYSKVYLGYTNTYSRNITSGAIRFYAKNGDILSEGEIADFSKTYSCMENDYSEQFQINYSRYQGENTAGKTLRVINRYPNGNKMNEGTLVNGLPDGLWLWYHFDGSLYQIGKYKNGQRTGRWLEGDLSKVRFLGETCLDPNSMEFARLLKEIEVQVKYFEDGELISNEYHSIRVD